MVRCLAVLDKRIGRMGDEQLFAEAALAVQDLGGWIGEKRFATASDGLIENALLLALADRCGTIARITRDENDQ